MHPVIHLKSGKLVLIKYNSDGTVTPSASTMIAGNGTVQSIAANVNIATTELADGNSDWPMGVYDTGKNGQITVTMSSFQPELYAALIGAAVEDEVNAGMWSAEEEHSVPSESPYTATLAHAYNGTGTIVIVGEDASPYAKVASNPSTGQFSVSSNTVTFHSADAGKEVLVTYEWDADTAKKISLPTSGSRPVVQAIISTEAVDEDEISTYDANIIVDKCKASGDVNQPVQQREGQTWSFTLRVLKPRSGYNPVYWKYAKRA